MPFIIKQEMDNKQRVEQYEIRLQNAKDIIQSVSRDMKNDGFCIGEVPNIEMIPITFSKDNPEIISFRIIMNKSWYEA